VLTVQDPSNPTTTADSYLSLADFRTRASSLGLTLATEDAAAEVQIRTGMQYVDSFRFAGEVIIPWQGTQWPRQNFIEYVNGVEYEYDNQKIPQQVIDAVLYVAVEDDIYVTQTAGERIQSAKVDVIETTYFDDGASANGFKRVVRADSLLSRFIAKTPNFGYPV